MSELGSESIRHARSFLDAVATGAQTPGIQYLVLNSSDTQFEYCGGTADLHRHLRMDTGVTMMAYSMSKTITAAAVLQLVEAGRIGLDTPLVQYLDSSPYGPAVTVRELLSHTSGIPNPIPLRWVHLAAQHNRFDQGAALEEVLKAHPRLSSEPGTRYRYSNIGYWLLGEVIARTSGQSFTAYVTDHLLRPLGTPASALGYTIANPDHHATGYLEKYSLTNLVKGFLIDPELVGEYDGRWLSIRTHYLNGAAFGGLVGTARGFGTFLQDQLRPHSRLFGDSTRGLFYAPQSTTRGMPIAMTLGWHIGSLQGTRFFYKEGGGGGFHCEMRLYPDKGIATVVMTNATGFGVKQCLNTLDPGFLP